MDENLNDVKQEENQTSSETSTDQNDSAGGEERVKKLEEQVQNLNKALASERHAKRRIVDEPKHTQETVVQDDDPYMGDIDKRIEARLSAEKSEQRKKSLSIAVEKFCNDHPEYLPEHDINDANWNKLNDKLKRFNPGDTVDEIYDALSFLDRGLKQPIQHEEPKTQVEDSGVGSGAGRIKTEIVKPTALTRSLNQYEVQALQVGMSSGIYKDENDYRQKLATLESTRKSK